MSITRLLKSPLTVLTVANILGAAVGVFSTIFAARWLGAEAYGVIGVLWGINAVALNFVDLRLTDLMVKLYYQPPPDGVTEKTYRASLWQICFFGYLGLAVIFSLLGAASAFAFLRFFTPQPIHSWWVLAGVAATAVNYLISPIMQGYRLEGRFTLIGSVTVVNAIFSSALLLIAVFYARNLDGYYGGLLLSALATAAVVFGCSLAGWMRRDRRLMFPGHGWPALPNFLREAKFLLWGNLLGYVKLAHRAGDVLLVGFLANDQLTGIYKLARSLTDKLYLLYDAANQVYQPLLMKLLQENAGREFRRRASRLLWVALFGTGLILTAEGLWYPAFHEIILANRFPGSQASVIWLTVPFAFILGIHLWAWPLVIHRRLAGFFSRLGALAVIGQYGVSYFAYRATGQPSAFAIGYLAYYVILLAPTVPWLLRPGRPAIPPRSPAPRL